jgi:esterase
MKLFFRKYGSGPPLVILHGLYGSSDNWATIAVKLSSHFTVIIPDLRNHGQSPHNQVHSYDSIAGDVNELVTDNIKGKFILAGHSMGGKAAMNFAMRWPEKLNGLVIIDVSPFGSPDPQNPFFKEHKEILDSMLSLDPGAITSRSEIESILSKHIHSERTRSFIMKNLKRKAEGNFEWKLNAPALLSNLPLITDGVFKKDENIFPVSGFPVVFISGENSNYINPVDFKSIQKIFPTAELITIKDAGHWIHAEKPDEISAVFIDLLKGN